MRSTTLHDPATDRATDAYGPAPAACYQSSGVPVANPQGVRRCGIVPAHTATTYDAGLQGLHVAYYSGSEEEPYLAGQPSLFNLGLAGVTGGAIDASWSDAPATGVSADYFSLRLTGLITFPEAGTYTLQTRTDDGVRVWLGDALMIDRWIPQSPTDATSQSFTVAAGETRRIRIEYFDEAWDVLLQLKWATPSNGSFTIVPGSALRPDYGNIASVTVDDAAPTGISGISDALVPSTTVTTDYGQYPWRGYNILGRVFGQSGVHPSAACNW